MEYLQSPTLQAQRRSPTEDGLIWRQLGSGQPPTGSVWPKLWSVVSHRLSNIGGIGIHGGIGLENGGLPKIGRNQGNMPWDIPFPPPIKGRPPPPYYKQHNKEEEHSSLELEQHFKGLRP